MVQVESEALTLRADLTALEIVDQPSYDAAVEKRKAAKAWLDEADAFFDPSIKMAYDLHRERITQKKTVTGPVVAALEATNRQLVAWDQQQERLRREAEQRLREDAAKAARDQQLEDAVHAAQSGAAPETVESILEAPAPIAPVVAPPTYEKSSAVVMRDNYKGECYDLHALIKAVAKDKSKLNLLQVNQPALNAMARALKETMNIPGVRAYNDRTVASGRG